MVSLRRHRQVSTTNGDLTYKVECTGYMFKKYKVTVLDTKTMEVKTEQAVKPVVDELGNMIFSVPGEPGSVLVVPRGFAVANLHTPETAVEKADEARPETENFEGGATSSFMVSGTDSKMM